MFQNSGLSLNQAPPIEVVLRLFLIGSLFGIALSFMLFFWHDNLSDISHPTTLTIVHTLTLGVMASFMLGALFQMMPVLCGVHIKAPIDLSVRVSFTLMFGVIILIFAFLKGESSLYIIASILIAFALFSSTFVMIKELLKIKHSNSSRGMLIALSSLVITIILALILVSMRVGIDIPLNYINLKSIHFSFGLFGWIAILIISVSFQVVEMFYVTPKYSNKYAKFTPLFIFGLLLIYMALQILGYNLAKYILNIILILLAIYALITVDKLKKKKRPINDASILFWYIGMSSLLLFALLGFLNISTLVTALFFTSFALSIMFAMSYKIVPFLVWFHLNAKGYFDAPMMHEVISPKYAKINFYIHTLALITTLIAIKFSIIFYFGSFLLLVSFSMLSYAIYGAWEKYDWTLRNGKKFNLNIN